MSLSGAPTWANMCRMSWTWSEWLECPVLWMLGSMMSLVGELVLALHGRALWPDGFLFRTSFLHVSACFSPVFAYGVSALVLGYHGLELWLPVYTTLAEP